MPGQMRRGQLSPELHRKFPAHIQVGQILLTMSPGPLPSMNVSGIPWFLNCPIPENILSAEVYSVWERHQGSPYIKESLQEAYCQANRTPIIPGGFFLRWYPMVWAWLDFLEPQLREGAATCSLLRAPCNPRKPGSLTQEKPGIIFSKSRTPKSQTMKGHQYKFQRAQPLGRGYFHGISIHIPFRYRAKECSLCILVKKIFFQTRVQTCP